MNGRAIWTLWDFLVDMHELGRPQRATPPHLVAQSHKVGSARDEDGETAEPSGHVAESHNVGSEPVEDGAAG